MLTSTGDRSQNKGVAGVVGDRLLVWDVVRGSSPRGLYDYSKDPRNITIAMTAGGGEDLSRRPSALRVGDDGTCRLASPCGGLWRLERDDRPGLDLVEGAHDGVAATLSPDGLLASSIDRTGLVRLSDPVTGRVLRTIASGRRARSLCLAEGRLALAGDDGLAVFDVDRGERIAATALEGLPRGVAWSGPGKRFLVAREDDVVAWDPGGRVSSPLARLPSELTFLNASPATPVFATGGADGMVRLWGLDGTALESFGGVNGAVTSLAFSVDGRWLAVGFLDGTIQLRDVAAKVVLATLTCERTAIVRIAFSPQRAYLGAVLGHADGQPAQVQLWSLDSLLQVVPSSEIVQATARATGFGVPEGSIDARVDRVR